MVGFLVSECGVTRLADLSLNITILERMVMDLEGRWNLECGNVYDLFFFWFYSRA